MISKVEEHQLTVQLQAINKEQDKLLYIFQEFKVDFEARLEPLTLAFIGTQQSWTGSPVPRRGSSLGNWGRK